MKPLKLSVCLCVCMLLLSLCSCGFFGDQKYICDVDKVESVQIVKLDKYVEGEYRYEYTVLSQILDYSTFIDQLTAIDQKVNWGEPKTVDVGYVVIKIEYSNGDYDLIYHNTQWKHRSGKNHTGYIFFNKEQFNTLIYDNMQSD